mmetsp:Transcript_10670/g.12867  ORF Transcript_10670/g.12867 Transcript_10670/m.12867 type:complete len:235 (+) Transcript_10670:131-835(+)
MEDLSRFRRRSSPDENNMVNIIEYKQFPESKAEESSGAITAPAGEKKYIRELSRVKLIVRDLESEKRVQERKHWKNHRFGAAAGAKGPEPGITTLSVEEFFILDPLSEEATMTKEDQILEKIKNKMKIQGSRERAPELMPRNFGQGSNSGGRRSGGRNSRSRGGSNRSPFPGYNQGRNSPSRNFNRDHSRNYNSGYGQSYGDRRSPGRAFNYNRNDRGRPTPSNSRKDERMNGN